MKVDLSNRQSSACLRVSPVRQSRQRWAGRDLPRGRRWRRGTRPADAVYFRRAVCDRSRRVLPAPRSGSRRQASAADGARRCGRPLERLPGHPLLECPRPRLARAATGGLPARVHAHGAGTARSPGALLSGLERLLWPLEPRRASARLPVRSRPPRGGAPSRPTWARRVLRRAADVVPTARPRCRPAPHRPHSRPEAPGQLPTAIEFAFARVTRARAAARPGGCLEAFALWHGAPRRGRPAHLCLASTGAWADGRLFPYGAAVFDAIQRG